MPHPYRTRAGVDDPQETLRRRVDELVARGLVTAERGRSRLSRAAGSWRVDAVTQPALGAKMRNVDRVLVLDVIVGGEPAIVLAITHGSEKDEATALASDAVVCELASRLDAPLSALSDVAPALVAAVHGCDHRWHEWFGARADLRGVGTSLLVGVVALEYGTLLHVGDVRALAVCDGVARQLVAPHVHAFDGNFRKKLPFAVEDRAWLAGDATQRMASGSLARLDPIQFPFPRGTRLVLGTRALDEVRVEALRTELPSTAATIAVVART